MWYDALLGKGLVPDTLVRSRIIQLLRQRLLEEEADDPEAVQKNHARLLERMDEGRLAVHTVEANEQHYEVPPRFFELVLGPRLKYSSALFAEPCASLAKAEEDMLALTCERADIQDGQEILELGCGWGSLTLYLAEKYPGCKITAVSNSRVQKQFIEECARGKGLFNVTVLTCDMNDFDPRMVFDRVVCVEMFEHMRNWRQLFAKIASWLRPEGRFFLHIFTHREISYFFAVKDESDWMAKYFFTGGLMPSDRLPLYFQEDLLIEKHWRVNGTHYQKTAEAWLSNLDRNRQEILSLFKEVYPGEEAPLRIAYWRIFFMACSELWGFERGTQWLVSHYRFQKRGPGECSINSGLRSFAAPE